jgi:rhomboid protease GluP
MPMGRSFRTCPACRAILTEGEAICPYCGEDARRPSVRRVELSPFSSRPEGEVTRILIAINLVCFAFELVSAAAATGFGGAFAALLNVPPDVLLQMGARNGSLIKQGEIWRLLVPVFLHGGLMHILFNCVAIYQVGPLSEQAYGRSRFLILYLVAGVAGNLLGLQFYGDRGVGIGASGALFGLIGAAGVYGHRRGGPYGLAIRRVMITWGIYSLLFGFLVRADNAAHLGGLASGILLSFLIGDRDLVRRNWSGWPVVAGILVAVTGASFVAAYNGYVHRGRADEFLAFAGQARAVRRAFASSVDAAPDSARVEARKEDLRTAAEAWASIPAMNAEMDGSRREMLAVVEERLGTPSEAPSELVLPLFAAFERGFNHYLVWEKSQVARYGLEYRDRPNAP